MQQRKLRRITALAATAAIGLTACSAKNGGELATLQKLAASCPHGRTLGDLVSYDVSGTARGSSAIASERDDTIRQIATEVAVCSGHLRISAFSSSAAASMIVFDQDLAPAGATQIARLRKVDALVDSAMRAIALGLVSAAGTLPSEGSDITGQFALASQYIRQVGPADHALHLQILTDGIQTVGVSLNTSRLTETAAASLARTATVSPLPADTEVSVVGLGRTSTKAAPSAYTDALVTFYTNYCHRTGTTHCTAAIDYTQGS